MAITGVSRGVEERMTEMQATVLTEDHFLLRRCEHGVAHPVGHLDRAMTALKAKEIKRHHETRGPRFGGPLGGATCCGCCGDWSQVSSAL